MSVKLYFYPTGGRAGAIRLLLNHGKVAFEDVRIPVDKIDAELEANPGRFPMNTVPTMQLEKKLLLGSGDDTSVVTLSQSNAIAAVAARLAGLAPKDGYQQALNDDMVFTLEDILIELTKSIGQEGEELKKSRDAAVAGVLSTGAKRINSLYEQGSEKGPFLGGEVPTVCDFMLFIIFRYVKSGALDHVPVEVLAAQPRLLAAVEGIAGLESVKAFMEKFPAL